MHTFAPRYSDSHALIVGISAYQHAPKLGHAHQDADAVAKAITKLGFPAEHVTLLTDENATRSNILRQYLSHAITAGADDRLFVYFAGHGHTMSGHRGDTGYLVPVDGDERDLSTLVAWRELIDKADVIPAKHLFFVMDACYGGLAFTRRPIQGASRLIRDMCRRFVRQALTAGKGDEVVADGDGIRPGHSIFTSHLLDALDGNARDEHGNLTASLVMAYVHQHVGSDGRSRQTPHYGFLEGDGDFIFDAPALATDPPQHTGDDQFYVIPSTLPDIEVEPPVEEKIRLYLSEPSRRIALDMLSATLFKRFDAAVSEDHFPLQGGNFKNTDIDERLAKYDTAVRDLESLVILTAHYGGAEQLTLLRKVMCGLCERFDMQGGMTVWLAMRWYPVLRIFYSGGIGAVANENYAALAAIFFPICNGDRSHQMVVLHMCEAYVSFRRSEAFKRVSGHERHYAPESEYLFKALQPHLDELLFTGRGYESHFDRFEILFSLACRVHGASDWSPYGRFAWKAYSMGRTNDPLSAVEKEAADAQDNWPPVRAGVFRNHLILEEGLKRLKAGIGNLNWH